MKATLLVREWYCPSCHIEHRERVEDSHKSARHKCLAHNGLDLPLVISGMQAHHIIRPREDYLNGDISDARDSKNRVIMSAYTEFADGSHETTVFMPCARLDTKVEGLN